MGGAFAGVWGAKPTRMPDRWGTAIATGESRLAHFVLVHGAFHGSWCWKEVAPLLEQAGHRVTSVDLHRGSRQADVAVLQEAVDAAARGGDDVIAVGHSLGCYGIAWLRPESLAHAVYLAGPLRGDDVPEPRTMDLFWQSVEYPADGWMRIPPEKAIALFYHDCAPDVAADAAARLIPNVVYDEPPEPEPPLWKAIPSTFVVCEDDRTLSPEYLEALAKFTAYRESLATSHSPMLSAPRELADVLIRAAARTAD